MQSLYVIVENGEPYPTAYKTYKEAVAAVKEKHSERLEEMIKELTQLDLVEEMLADVNVPENTSSWKTHLYIEKGINIEICKFSV
jgi:broad specificity polyphosphatase/5'/3'-nucleotidase SurE